MRSAAALLCLALAGCLSPGASEEPAAWALPVPETTPSFPVRVFVPAELRRPSVVTCEPGEQPQGHDHDRWSSPLPVALARVVGGEVAGLPLRSVTLVFRRLEAGRTGLHRLEASVQMELVTTSDGRVAPLSLELRLSGSTGMEQVSLGNAVEAYALAARESGQAIRARVKAELGEVAKPSGAVSVPGK